MSTQDSGYCKTPSGEPSGPKTEELGPRAQGRARPPCKRHQSEDAFSAVEKPDAPGSGGSLQSDRGGAVPQGGGVGRLSAASPRNHAGQENWTTCQITAHSLSRAALLHPALQVWPRELL